MFARSGAGRVEVDFDASSRHLLPRDLVERLFVVGIF